MDAMGVREGPEGLDEFNALPPVPLSPDQLDPRMIAQRGIYTLHTFMRGALERLAEEDHDTNGDACFLHKITIPKQAKSGLLSELLQVAGVTEETLFPDIGGFARGFNMEARRRAAGEIGPGADRE